MSFAPLFSLSHGHRKRYSPLSIALLLSVLILGFVSPQVGAQSGDSVELDRGTVDYDRVGDVQRWERVRFTVSQSGTHTVQVDWQGNADIRFSVFESASRTRIGTSSNTDATGQWTGNLNASTSYFLGVWSASGRANFVATIAVGTPQTPADGAFSGALSDTAASSWDAAGEVHRVLTVGDTLFVGGEFNSIYDTNGETLSRTYLAAFNRYTGRPTNFAPILDNHVRALALSPDERTLYVAGAFRRVNGQDRARVAAFDVETGVLTEFNPPAPNNVLRAIAVTEDKVYLGGLFTRIGGQARSYVAAFDPRTGALDRNFRPTPGAQIKALVAGSEGLWIGGDFFRVQQRSQRGIALVDLDSGLLKRSDEVTAHVIDLAATSSQLFIAIGGPGGRGAAFDRATRTEQWTIVSDGNFQGVAVGEGRYVYFGGHHERVEGNRNADRMTRHDKLTGRLDTTWLPNINGFRSVNAVEVRSDALYIGGDFSRIGNQPREGFAILPGRTQ